MKNSILVLVCVATLATLPGCFKDLSCSKKSNSATPSTPVKTNPVPSPAPSAQTAPASHPSSMPPVANNQTAPVAAPEAKATPAASTSSETTKA